MEKASKIKKDESWMKRAIALAGRGVGKVNPNPLVGAVFMKDDKVIGEGWHEAYGGPHGERNGIADCILRCGGNEKKARELMKGATLYVTLEPCCHHGKTPPCTEAILEWGIKRVVIGTLDPNPLISGKGVRILQEKGLHVEIGVLEGECRKQNEIFFHFMRTGMPFVLLKYAMTMDGKIATRTGHSQWVTGELARANVHEMRRRLMGIMVGVNTVLKDDPLLNCRIQGMDRGDGNEVDQIRQPVRIICDSRLRIPIHSHIVDTARDYETIVACGEPPTLNEREHEEKKKRLKEKGIDVWQFSTEEGEKDEKTARVDLVALMKRLAEKGIDSVLLEGGGELNDNALQRDIVSKVYVYLAPKIFGGREAKTPVEGEGITLATDAKTWLLDEIKFFGEDVLLTYDRRGQDQR